MIAHIPLSQLRALPGAQELEDAWIRARLGEDGYLTGKDAETAACDAPVVPVVTATLDLDVIDQMIDLARTAAQAQAGVSDPAGHADISAAPPDSPAPAGNTCSTSDAPTADDIDDIDEPDVRDSGNLDDGSPAGPGVRTRSQRLSPEAWRALRYAMARLAVDLVSGPAGVAAILRQGLLDQPYNTPSLPLDIGYSDSIPWYIRRAVQLRDKKCAWPKCGRPAVYCDVHHLRHKEDGGETSVDNLILVCQYHHDVCIHRRGWQLILHPDGTTEARSPDGTQVLRSHAPPNQRAALSAWP